MALEQYAVRLTPEERERLSQLIRSGKSSARIIARARTLLKVDEGWNAPQVAAALDISSGSVDSIRVECDGSAVVPYGLVQRWVVEVSQEVWAVGMVMNREECQTNERHWSC